MAIKRRIKRSVRADDIILFEAFEEFIAEKEANNLSEPTIRNYRQSFEYFCQSAHYDNTTTTDDVDIQAIYKWIGTLKLNGVSPNSINHYLRDVRAFLYWCMNSDRKYIDPPFKVKQVEAQEELPKMFSDDELEALLEKPRKQDGFPEWRAWAITNWVLGTGNRASTIIDVRIGDIDFTHKEISLGHTKNKKAQIIPLSSSLETVLKEYIRVWRKEVDDDAWLFPNIGEEQLTTNALRLAFRRYCNGRGVEKTNIHGLRHNFAKGWVKNNGNMFALQKLLGHSSLDMVRKYVKLYSEDIKEDFDSFSPLDTIKKGSRRTQTVKRSK